MDVDTAASSATTLGVPPSAPRSSSSPTPAPAVSAAVAPGSGTATTPKEFAAAMADIAAISDEETAHIMADDLMVNLLRELGYGEAMDIFVAMGKWYA